MNNNFLVATGTILKEYMNARGITQKEMARIIGSSEKHISNLINGKAKLSDEIALKLEIVFPDIKAEFWIDLEKNYRLSLLREEKSESEELKSIAKEYQFGHVFEGLKYSLINQANEMLRILEVKSFEEAEEKINGLNYNFMEDGGNIKAIYTWLKLCEYEIDLQNDIKNLPNYNLEGLISNLPLLKNLLYTNVFELAEKNIRRFLNRYGVPLVILEALPSSKVRGATTIIDNKPVVFLSTRFKRFDTFYFTLIHEIAHIINNDDNLKYMITYDYEDSEIISNQFARDFFVKKNDYEDFCKKFKRKEIVSDEEIIVFANEQKVIPDVIIGFLEHDNIIDYSRYYHLRSGIKM